VWPPLERAASFASELAARATAVRESYRVAGVPVPSALTTEVARPSVTSINSPWREALQELKPIDLACILRDAVNGNADQYLRLCEEMEEREPHYRSVLNTRKLAITGIPISIDAPSDSAHDLAIADDVEELLQRPEAEGMVTDLLDGIAKGYSCVEIIWQRDVKRWEPARYEWRSQRHFVFDRDTLTTPRLRTPEHSWDGEELQPFKWMIHRPKLTSGVPLRGGIGMPVSLAYMAKKYTIADWLTFLDIFGMPVRIGKFPADMAKRKNELLRAMQMIGTDSAAVIPKEMEVQFLEAKGTGGGTLFQATAEYWDKQTSKIVLGQTMSSDDGASLSQAKVHQEVRREIRDADARAVASTITRDLIIPFVQLNYGPQDKYPRCAFRSPEPEDTLKLAQMAAVLVDIGVPIQASELRDRCGFSEPDEDADLCKPAAVVVAEQLPKPDPATPADPNDPKAPAPKGGDSSKPPPVAVPGPKELNRAESKASLLRLVELLSTAAKTGDMVSMTTDEVLDNWERLIDPNVGVMIERLRTATTFDEASEILQTLSEDAGVELDIQSFVDTLARSDFKLRGIGNATDRQIKP
jgi:phage gp29-like protein